MTACFPPVNAVTWIENARTKLAKNSSLKSTMASAGRPSLSHDEVREVLRNGYGIDGVYRLESLPSFQDQNFLIRVG